MKYVKSGIFAKNVDEFLHELNNLISLLVKNAEESCEFIAGYSENINIILQEYPYLELVPCYEEYFQSLFYFLESSSHSHVLSNALLLPRTQKALIIEKVCSLKDYKFKYVQTLIELNFAPGEDTIVYFDGKDPILTRSAFIYLS